MAHSTLHFSICMYVCIKIYVRAAAYSLDCHEGAMINCRLYRTFQSLSVNRTETVTSSYRELSVVVSSTVLDQSTRNFVVHSSWSCSNCSLSVRSIIITQLFSITILWSYSCPLVLVLYYARPIFTGVKRWHWRCLNGLSHALPMSNPRHKVERLREQRWCTRAVWPW